jgi:hypothetical protein
VLCQIHFIWLDGANIICVNHIFLYYSAFAKNSKFWSGHIRKSWTLSLSRGSCDGVHKNYQLI